MQNPSRIEVDSERAQYWLSVGAQPTEPVMAILKLTGDWQKFKGLPAPAPLLVAEPKADKRAAFEAAAKDAARGRRRRRRVEAITPRRPRRPTRRRTEAAGRQSRPSPTEA